MENNNEINIFQSLKLFKINSIFKNPITLFLKRFSENKFQI